MNPINLEILFFFSDGLTYGVDQLGKGFRQHI